MAVTLNFTLNQVVKNTSLSPTSTGGISANEPIPVRVLGVILDENDKFFEDSDIPNESRPNYFGTIKFQDYNNPIYNAIDENANITLLARPINPNIKHYPLKNEIVYVLVLPNQNSKNNLNTYSFYYYPPINMENNITSNPIVPTYQQSQQNDISPEDTIDGVPVNINAEQKQIKNLLGKNFPTNLSKTLSKTFEGDIMYEGRFGNSLRFSSDLYNGEGQEGEPLTILANQAGDNLVEDINQDKASVYLTTNQKIPINISSLNLDSFIPPKPTPSKPSNIRPVESYTNNTEFTGPNPENTNSTSQIESQECKEIPKTWDPASDRRISSLHPLIRCDVAKIINRAERELGITFRVTQGFRTIEEQNKLYAKGRTTSGKIVTNAKGGESYHNYGLSFDVVQIKDRKALWKGESGREIEYEQLANIAKQYGFEWGGDWVSFVDKPHFQKVYNKTTSQLFALTDISEQPYPNIA